VWPTRPLGKRLSRIGARDERERGAGRACCQVRNAYFLLMWPILSCPTRTLFTFDYLIDSLSFLLMCSPGAPPATDIVAVAAAIKKTRKKPKLMYENLKESRGIPDVFNNFPVMFHRGFRGKGHEISDTRKLLEQFKRWQLRVFPLSDFDTFIAEIEKMSTSNIVKMDLHEMRENLLQVAVNESKLGLEGLDAETRQDKETIHGDDDDDDELIRLAMTDDPDHLTAGNIDKSQSATQEDEDLLNLLFEKDTSKPEEDEKDDEIEDDELLALAFS